MMIVILIKMYAYVVPVVSGMMEPVRVLQDQRPEMHGLHLMKATKISMSGEKLGAIIHLNI